MIQINKILTVLIIFLGTQAAYALSTPPANNQCSGATATAATSGTTCTTTSLQNSTVGASGEPYSSCNTTTENTSTWYSIVATDSNMTFFGTNAAGNGVSCDHSVTVYSGTCGSLTEIGCAFDFYNVAAPVTGLTPGVTYYVQISYASGGPCGNLDVCVYACATPDEDNCGGALPIGPTPQSLDNLCTTPGPTTNSPSAITPGNLCAGSLENTAWYTFTVLNTADVVITISNIVCAGGGAGFQIGYFTGSCGNLSNIGCQSGSGGTVTATITGLNAGDVVTIAIDGNAGAECTYDISATNTVPLPIELVSFNAKAIQNAYVELGWTTLSEINNNYFTIEKSRDGVNFEVVGIVDGAGNSTMVRNYNMDDYQPYPGLSYYRLKQTDYDENYSYSKLVSVEIESEFEDLNVFPNPVTGNAQLTFSANSVANATIAIYDVSGRKVSSKKLATKSGVNNIALNTESLNRGMYFLTIDNGIEATTVKFIKE